MQEIINRIATLEHGFKPIEAEALALFKSRSVQECLTIARELLKHDLYQVRALGVFLLGNVASKDATALQTLKEKVSHDPSWQVQEILAKAFDRYCKDTGYEKALPIIGEWLNELNPNVCRAVTEGLRIWTGRPYFNTHPQAAIQLISQHKANESAYLRKSVGNSLRDIAKKYPELIERELATWDLSDKRISFTCRLVRKKKKS